MNANDLEVKIKALKLELLGLEAQRPVATVYRLYHEVYASPRLGRPREDQVVVFRGESYTGLSVSAASGTSCVALNGWPRHGSATKQEALEALAAILAEDVATAEKRLAEALDCLSKLPTSVEHILWEPQV